MALDTARDDALLAAMAACPPSPLFLSVYTAQILPTASTKIKSPPPKRSSPSQLCHEPLIAAGHGPCGWGLKSQRKAGLSSRGSARGSRARAAHQGARGGVAAPLADQRRSQLARQPLSTPPRPRAPHRAQAEVGATRGGGRPSQTNATIAFIALIRKILAWITWIVLLVSTLIGVSRKLVLIYRTGSTASGCTSPSSPRPRQARGSASWRLTPRGTTSCPLPWQLPLPLLRSSPYTPAKSSLLPPLKSNPLHPSVRHLPSSVVSHSSSLATAHAVGD
jgi:hypothetical protein